MYGPSSSRQASHRCLMASEAAAAESWCVSPADTVTAMIRIAVEHSLQMVHCVTQQGTCLVCREALTLSQKLQQSRYEISSLAALQCVRQPVGIGCYSEGRGVLQQRLLRQAGHALQQGQQQWVPCGRRRPVHRPAPSRGTRISGGPPLEQSTKIFRI